MNEEVKKMAHLHEHTNRNEEDKKKLLTRLRRIEGQVRGIQKMVEDDRYCIDIMMQINAIHSGMKQVSYSLLEDHANHCVMDAIDSGDGKEAVKELIDVIKMQNK